MTFAHPASPLLAQGSPQHRVEALGDAFRAHEQGVLLRADSLAEPDLDPIPAELPAQAGSAAALACVGPDRRAF